MPVVPFTPQPFVPAPAPPPDPVYLAMAAAMTKADTKKAVPNGK
jgi:hypothetical protein